MVTSKKPKQGAWTKLPQDFQNESNQEHPDIKTVSCFRCGYHIERSARDIMFCRSCGLYLRLRVEAGAFRTVEIDKRESKIIEILSESENLTLPMIVAKLNSSYFSTRRLLETLIQQGLVARKSNWRDLFIYRLKDTTALPKPRSLEERKQK